VEEQWFGKEALLPESGDRGRRVGLGWENRRREPRVCVELFHHSVREGIQKREKTYLNSRVVGILI
jgi:hypothetical protein